MIVFSSEYVVVESICSRCAPCLARVSASSLPLRPQWAGIHCRVVLYLLDRSVSFVNRLCCSLSLLLLIDWRTERASVRITLEERPISYRDIAFFFLQIIVSVS